MSVERIILKIIIQLVTLFRATTAAIFILSCQILSAEILSILLILAYASDLIDGYLARKYNLTTKGGQLLDLFSDKYLNLILITFLITERQPLLPLLIILTKEIFVLSFRSIEIDGKMIISTNRYLGGCMSFLLLLVTLSHINHFFSYNDFAITALGLFNFIYFVYKIKANATDILNVFKDQI